LAPSKNVEAILQLARIWPEKNFVIAGPGGSDFDRVKNAAQHMKIGNVTLLPSIDTRQKAWLYQHCDAFLFPSIAEGFGLPPIEAMYFGKPVFASNRTSLPEICGNNAFYFDDFMPEKMRDVVELGLQTYAKDNPSEAIKLHTRRFSWEKAAQSYLTLYLQLASNSKRMLEK
jgi:glycosyltransferase involved in cell wall biosynthesis